MVPSHLSLADEPALARSEHLASVIREEISRAGGRLEFDRYMNLALNAPGLGYYRAPMRRFGEGGDFITAPELSPLFSRCVARQIVDILSRAGNGEVLEVGAGSGRLCAGLLNALDELGQAPVHYRILEPSADLRARQQSTIETEARDFRERVSWVNDLPSAGFKGVIIANEMLDALPVRRFRISNGRVEEAFVEWRRGGFQWCFDSSRDGMPEATVADIEQALGKPLPQHYVSELGPQRGAWIQRAAAGLERGALLLFDYGYPLTEYYHPQRVDGTLRCFLRHRSHDDPFLYPGLQDISVHVEFTSLATAATEAGLEIGGFTTQAEFLLASGLLEMCSDVDPRSERFFLLTRQIKRLTLPEEMGELIKVVAFTRKIGLPMEGFSGRDLRNLLA
ncbi:MAG TPA: SAM-dependent methyltransferase [Gammaproteobacteria bacterium]